MPIDDQPPITRYRWLDALRGLGATAVLLEHMTYRFLPDVRPTWFNLGNYGVLVFFLVSGYIIPASLERRGDVRAFWIGRVFRLYPLYVLTIVIVLAMASIAPLRKNIDLVGHITMLMEVTGSWAFTEPMWTLSYEMVFYILVTALFVAGVHRRSGLFALAFGLLSVLVAFAMPTRGLLGGPVVPVVVLAVLLAGLGGVLFGSGRVRTAGALILGTLAIALVVVGSRVPWQGAMVLAVMFTGTVIHRWERGQGSGIWPVLGVAFLICLTPFMKPVTVNGMANLMTVALAGGTFCLFYALRGRRIPYGLAWLGLISYSVYMLHMPLLRLFFFVAGDPLRFPVVVQLGLGLGVLAAVCGVSWLTYRFVELPMQRVGRRLAKGRPAVPSPPRDRITIG
ncbi:acyltransferase [Microtetraspora sp. AC03309]|uniref:acyltransferase family protein n=1 Tax=Microtetraspora sp. AC03309 TaxID=2779376 RepID=UPI001E65250E|nr:acyltransferase [Microtetraspora sp. AC03309]MCC5577160.1 acyltransferase [Microtetraspora sp. AC03309]